MALNNLSCSNLPLRSLAVMHVISILNSYAFLSVRREHYWILDQPQLVHSAWAEFCSGQKFKHFCMTVVLLYQMDRRLKTWFMLTCWENWFSALLCAKFTYTYVCVVFSGTLVSIYVFVVFFRNTLCSICNFERYLSSYSLHCLFFVQENCMFYCLLFQRNV